MFGNSNLLNLIAGIAFILGIINFIMLLIKNKDINIKDINIDKIIFMIMLNILNYVVIVGPPVGGLLEHEPTITSRIFYNVSPIFILAIQIIIFIYLIATIVKTKKEGKRCQE